MIGTRIDVVSDLRRCYVQIDALFDETLPALPVSERFIVGESVPPRPAAGRYSSDMLECVECGAFAVFPTADALVDKSDIVDRFVCYLTEYLVRNADALRLNVPGNGPPVYQEIGPSVCYDYTPAVDNPVDMLLSMVEHGDGFADEIADRIEEYRDVKGDGCRSNPVAREERTTAGPEARTRAHTRVTPAPPGEAAARRFPGSRVSMPPVERELDRALPVPGDGTTRAGRDMRAREQERAREPRGR